MKTKIQANMNFAMEFHIGGGGISRAKSSSTLWKWLVPLCVAGIKILWAWYHGGGHLPS